MSIPITSTFYLQSSLVDKRQPHPSSCSDQILAPLLCSCPTSNSSANPVGCFLQNISIFPVSSSFGRMNLGPWLELDHHLTSKQSQPCHQYLPWEKQDSMTFVSASSRHRKNPGLPEDPSVPRHSSPYGCASASLSLSGSSCQPLKPFHHAFWNTWSIVS